MSKRMYCQAEALCAMRPKHTAIIRFSTWKDENGEYGREKAIPVCDVHRYPYFRTEPGTLILNQTSVTLVSWTENTFAPDTL
jgi:hypothetical protein